MMELIPTDDEYEEGFETIQSSDFSLPDQETEGTSSTLTKRNSQLPEIATSQACRK